MDFNNTRYYEILGVTKDASFDNIERAKERLKYGNSDDRVPFSMWPDIDEAYNVLIKPESRKKYDEYLKKMSFFGGNVIYSSSELEAENSEKELEAIEKVNETTKTTEEVDEKIEEKSEEKVEEIKPPIIEDKNSIDLNNITSNNENEVTDTSEKDPELVATQDYHAILNDEIDHLLMFPNNNYKLEINMLKYKRKIELLEKILDIRKSRVLKGKIDAIKNKVEITSIINQLDTNIKKYEELKGKVKQYNNGSKSKLSKVNSSVIKNAEEIQGLESKLDKKFTEKVKLSKLQFNQKFLTIARTGLAKATKFKVYRLGKFRDGIAKFTDKFTSLSSVFKKNEYVDKSYDAIVDVSSKIR